MHPTSYRAPDLSKRYRQRRAAAIGLGTAAVIGLAIVGHTVTSDPNAQLPSSTTRPRATEAPTLADYPARVPLPASLAHAIGRARADQESGCSADDGTAYAFAVIDEGGNVQRIVTGCGSTERTHEARTSASVVIGTPLTATSSPRITEDSPGWNCHTMGNHICGSTMPETK